MFDEADDMFDQASSYQHQAQYNNIQRGFQPSVAPRDSMLPPSS